LLTVTSPADDTTTSDGLLTVAGTVEYETNGEAAPPRPTPPDAPPPYDGTLTVEHRGLFEVEQSTLGVTDQVSPIDSSHHYTLDLTNAHVAFELKWQDIFPVPPESDLDLFVTGQGIDSGAAGATSENPEAIELTDVTGHLDIRVRPTFVNTVTDYTLTITVTPLDGAFGGLSPPDEDFDDTPNDVDACPWYPGIGADGCTPLTPSQVTVYVDGVNAGVAEVHAEYWRDGFSIPITVSEGPHQIRIDWVDGGGVLASRTLTVT